MDGIVGGFRHSLINVNGFAVLEKIYLILTVRDWSFLVLAIPLHLSCDFFSVSDEPYI